MRICEILASNGEGGLEKHVIDLCNGIAEMGHEVHVIVSAYFKDRFSPTVEVHLLDVCRSRHNPFLWFQLWNILRRIEPDVIHAQANKATCLLARIKPFLSPPCVATIHNQKSRRSMFKSMDGVIGVSQGALSVVEHPLRRCIYNGLNTTADERSESSRRQALYELVGITGQRPVAVSIARLVAAKRIDLLIEAWQGIDADLVIIGDGPLRERLQRQVHALGLEKCIHFAGFVANASAFIPGADLLVISSDREGFPYVLVEALMAKTPVISTNVAAAIEALPESLRVDKGDCVGMNLKISDFFSNRSNFDNDLNEVFDWARQVLTVANMAQSTVDFFDEIRAACSREGLEKPGDSTV